MTVVASLAVSLGAASSAGASPIDVLNQMKLQMQIRQQLHATLCSNLMNSMIQDYALMDSAPTSSGAQDLARDRSVAIANGCPII